MMALAYGVTRAGEGGWGHPATLAALGAAALLLAGFVAIQARSADPMLPLSVLAERNRAGSYGAMLLFGAGMMGTYYLLTLGVASAVVNMAQQIGAALGIAAMTAISTAVAGAKVPNAATALASGYSAAFMAGAAMLLLAVVVVGWAVNTREAQKAGDALAQ